MFQATLPVLSALVAFACAGKETPVFSDEIKEIIQHVHNECVSKTGAAEEDIANCENGIFKEDPKLKCYMFCLMEEASLTDEHDNVDYDMMVSLIPEQYTDRVKKMIFGCNHLDTPDKDRCQRAFDVHKCSYEKDPHDQDLCSGLNFLRRQRNIRRARRPLPAEPLSGKWSATICIATLEASGPANCCRDSIDAT